MKNTPPKKIHPLAVLTLLVGSVLLLFLAWRLWFEESAANRLANIALSSDISELISGKADEVDFERDLKALWNSQKTTSDIDSLSSAKDLAQFDSMPINSDRNSFQPKSKLDLSTNNNTDSTGNSSNLSKPLQGTYSASQQEFVQKFMSDIPYSPEEHVLLAMRNIAISQGTGGEELWHLQADWATLQKAGSVLRMQDPKLLYALGEKKSLPLIQNSKQENPSVQPQSETPLSMENLIFSSQNATQINPLHALSVEAQHGFVYENNTKIKLLDGVLASYQEHSVLGSVLEYHSEDDTVRFPYSAHFKGNNIFGDALVLSWDLTHNTLIGKGKVHVTWLPAK